MANVDDMIIEKEMVLKISAIPEIPVYKPTIADFKNFSRYVEKLERLGAHHIGLCKVIPPPSWTARHGGYTDIGNEQIEKPVCQVTYGGRGIFFQDISSRRTITFHEFSKMTQSAEYRPPRCPDWNHLEKKYWSSISTARPLYGANVSGSLMRNQPVWNLSNLDCTLSRVLRSQNIVIPGVNSPYLYYGMWRSTFPWHVEDMDLYSINYLHYGYPKQWYVIPPAYARKFEAFVFEHFRSDFLKCNSFIRHKCVLIDPKLLAKANIPTRKILQRRGEFMITFPYAYHAGFNTGLNIAEAVNFALPRWVEFGKKAQLCSCWSDTVRISLDPFVRMYQPDLYADWLDGNDTSLHPLDEYLAGRNAVLHKVVTIGADATKVPTNMERNGTGTLVSPVTSSTISLTRKLKKSIGDINSIDVRYKSAAFSNAELPFHVKIHPKLSSLWCGHKENFDELRNFNRMIAAFRPHCAICSLLWTPQKTATVLSLPPRDSMCIPCVGVPYIPDIAYWKSARKPVPLEVTATLECQILQCSRCCVSVHARCYGVSLAMPSTSSPAAPNRRRPSGGSRLSEAVASTDWTCDACLAAAPPSCLLCYLRGGAMKALANRPHPHTGRHYWAHVVCALASPACRFISVLKRLAFVTQEGIEIALSKQTLQAGNSDVNVDPCRHELTSRKRSLNRYARVNSSPAKVSKPKPQWTSELQHSPTAANEFHRNRIADPQLLSCVVCRLPGRGHIPLAKCWGKNCDRLFHVTCAQMAGVVIATDTYPDFFFLACDEHSAEGLSESSEVETIKPGDRVLVRLARYPPSYVTGVVNQRMTLPYCNLYFTDSTYSCDTEPKFLIGIDYEKDGLPPEGSTVTVAWSDGLTYPATYLGLKPGKWEIRLENGNSVTLERGEFFAVRAAPHK